MRAWSMVATAATAAWLAGSAAADVTTTGEFDGDVFEGFEANQPPGAYPNLPVFENNGTLHDSLATIGVIAVNWWGPGGEVLAYNGNFFGGTPAGSSIYEFSTPIVAFGGFLTTVSDVPDAIAIFRDAEGAELATLTVTLTPTVWGWQGWQSDVPIGSIEFVQNGPFGNRPVQYDDLRITFASAACPGDLNGDGIVDVTDLAALLSNFGTLSGATAEQGDGDGDGDVDLADLTAFLSNFGNTCP